MSEKSQDDCIPTTQAIHMYPTHRTLPPVTASGPVVPSHTPFHEGQVEIPSSTSSSFVPRPKHRFPIPAFHDPTASLAPLIAATAQQTSANTHAFATTTASSSVQMSHRQNSGLTQVLAAGLISYGQQGLAQSPQTASQIQAQQQQHQFQKLKVEDALSYLDQVKFQFGNQPQVYNDFLDIMKEFKSQSIDTPGVIARVSNLFNGHPDLIVGFNTFLPPGYKIEVSANDQVSVTGPNMMSHTVHPLSGLIEQSQQSTTIQVHTPQGKFATTLPQLPTHRSSPGPHPPQIANPTIPSSGFPATQPRAAMPLVSSSLTQGPNTNTAVSSHQAGAGGLLGQPQTTGAGGQPVEFNHAINYVNKIKSRFQDQPDIYKAFLEILHKYQKEQRNVKDSNGAYIPSLSESEVYAQVARLFQSDEDLLREFGQFLPDAGGAVGASMTSSLSHSISHAATSPSPSIKADSVMNDHGSTVKKLPSYPATKTNRPNSHQSVKRPGQISHLSSKRAKSCSVKDISAAEASKHGTLSEFAFFDKVRRALRNGEAYNNFLRCLLLYNNEIIGKVELVQLVQTYLMKYTELFAWFKQFVKYNDGPVMETGNEIMIQQQQPPKEKHEGMAMEIDYTTLKRLGSSYRALPPSFQQPSCTGRDALCREVLNDVWVSFPSWSEDSQFVTSKKTIYEENIYRCEDERYELDVVIETNLAAIRCLETVNKKLTRMSDDDKAKFRLDSCLGGTSEVTQRKAIHRIYGDKGSDIIEGLKKNPGVAVPVVLKRLKAKDDEWKEAQHLFNKLWRSQNEKFYLRSLDHQGITFKTNDTRFLRSKSLVNEIETLYDERQETIENGSSLISNGPHITLTYEDKSIMDDAASLIIHHVKRQSAIHKDDKQKVRQVMYQVLPDLYFAPRGNQPSDDDDDDEDDDETDGEIPKNKINHKKAPHKMYEGYSANDNVEGHYHLFFGNNNFYLFFRLHHILCDRLLTVCRHAEVLAEEDAKERKEKKSETVVEMLRLRQTNDIEVEDYYPTFLDMVRSLLDCNIECSVYEDTLREMFTIHAYTTFTMDRLVQNIVRQLQHIVQDDTCVQLLELYNREERNMSTGGALVSQARRLNVESSYQRKAEHLTTDENCFKITICQKQGQLRIGLELLDTDEEHGIDVVEVAKWSEYLEHYVGSDDVQITPQMKERLSEKPVFLQRNANHLRRISKNSDEDYQNLIIHSNLECKMQTGSYKMAFVPGSEDITYRHACIVAARAAQNRVTDRCHDKFTAWLSKWEQENVSRDMARQTSNWLLGKTSGLLSNATSVSTRKSGSLSRNFYGVSMTESSV